MATRRQTRSPSEEDSLLDDEFSSITDEDIAAFMAEQAAEEEEKEKRGFWNLQTASGLGMIALGSVYLLQQVGWLSLGASLATLVSLLPWLAGILIVLTGFGVLSWRPGTRRRKKARRRAAKARARRERKRTAKRKQQAQSGSEEQARRAFEKAERGTEKAFERMERAFSNRYASARKRGLVRSRRRRMIAGVASGIADYLGIEPTLVRIAFVIATIVASGIGIPLYIVLAFLIPDEGRKASHNDDPQVRVVRD